jgi:hypothetical protein
MSEGAKGVAGRLAHDSPAGSVISCRWLLALYDDPGQLQTRRESSGGSTPSRPTSPDFGSKIHPSGAPSACSSPAPRLASIADLPDAERVSGPFRITPPPSPLVEASGPVVVLQDPQSRHAASRFEKLLPNSLSPELRQHVECVEFLAIEGDEADGTVRLLSNEYPSFKLCPALNDLIERVGLAWIDVRESHDSGSSLDVRN